MLSCYPNSFNNLQNGMTFASWPVVLHPYPEAIMNVNVFAGSLLSGLVFTASLSAQQVAANVYVRGGPIAGHVIVDHGYSTYRRPEYRHPDARRVVVVERHAPRVIVVERVRAHRHRNYWGRHGYRPVTLFYVAGRYYDRWIAGPRVREIVVYERDGRYYEDCDHDRDYR